MEENKESSSSKHQNSDLEDGTSSIDNQNKLTESTSETDIYNKISGEAENPLDHNKISGETEDTLIYNKSSGESEDPLIHKKISGEDEDTLIHNKISGEAENLPIHNIISSEAENLPINKVSGEAEDPLIHNKISGDASPTSFSSSSHLLEIDYDENAFDISFSISEEDEDISNTQQWSMVSASPQDGPTADQELPLSPENASPKQSPAVQEMERTSSYDPKRIPSSTFSRKLTDTTEWSADSNDSLFSLSLGRSGELTRADSSFPLPTVIETTSEIDQKSTMGEIQNQSDVPVVNADGNGVNPSEMPCDSITALPQPQPPLPPTSPPPVSEGKEAAETKSEDRAPTPKGRCKCFNCFSCCTFCG